MANGTSTTQAANNPVGDQSLPYAQRQANALSTIMSGNALSPSAQSPAFSQMLAGASQYGPMRAGMAGGNVWGGSQGIGPWGQAPLTAMNSPMQQGAMVPNLTKAQNMQTNYNNVTNRLNTLNDRFNGLNDTTTPRALSLMDRIAGLQDRQSGIAQRMSNLGVPAEWPGPQSAPPVNLPLQSGYQGAQPATPTNINDLIGGMNAVTAAYQNQLVPPEPVTTTTTKKKNTSKYEPAPVKIKMSSWN